MNLIAVPDSAGVVARDGGAISSAIVHQRHVHAFRQAIRDRRSRCDRFEQPLLQLHGGRDRVSEDRRVPKNDGPSLHVRRLRGYAVLWPRSCPTDCRALLYPSPSRGRPPRRARGRPPRGSAHPGSAHGLHRGNRTLARQSHRIVVGRRDRRRGTPPPSGCRRTARRCTRYIQFTLESSTPKHWAQ